MGINLTSSQQLLDSIVNWFVPASILKDVDKTKNVRMFLISHLMGP